MNLELIAALGILLGCVPSNSGAVWTGCVKQHLPLTVIVPEGSRFLIPAGTTIYMARSPG